MSIDLASYTQEMLKLQGLNKASIISEGKQQRSKESKTDDKSSTLIVKKFIFADDITTPDWVYSFRTGSFTSSKKHSSTAPILYLMESSELLSLKRFPYSATAKDFTSAESFIDGEEDLIVPNTEFYVNGIELVNLISGVEYDGKCKTLSGKDAYLELRNTANGVSLWILKSEDMTNVDCIYVNPSNKADGIKEEYYSIFPQLSSRLDEIASNQLKSESPDEYSADIAAYYRSILNNQVIEKRI